MRLPIFVSFATFALSACATVFNGKMQSVELNSEPTGASVSVTNRKGEVVQTATTPTMLTLQRGAGYFKPEQYTVAYSKPGYAPQETQLKATVSGWYAGNIIFGGLIGLLIVDPATGAMYTLPKSVDEKMTAQTANATTANVGSGQLQTANVPAH
ncbi:MAG TPA: hypothetical protein VMJ74_04925 [Pseudomonadales bacterium]|nr:hypothetical protein [Pseudomonadales bacterium]